MKCNANFVLRKKSVSQFFVHLCTWFNFFRHSKDFLPRHCKGGLGQHCEDFLLCHCEERSDVAIQEEPTCTKLKFWQVEAIYKNSSNKHTNSGLPHSRWSLPMIPAFSLVELLMALLVASILMAALAPVMTKKFGESVNVNGIGNYERQGYGRLFNNDDTWKVPAGVNTVKITAVGGGGAGGSTTYAYKKFTYTGSVQNFIVPNGVTKIRVYAIAGGGGGASGGDGANIAYGTLKGSGEQEYKTAGTNQTWSVNANSKIPAIDSRCALSNVNTWLLTSDNKTVMTPNNSYVHVQACGGGGGGSPYAGGGSGGKIDKMIQLASNISKVYLTIGGGGGGGRGGIGDGGAAGGNGVGYGGGGGGCEAPGSNIALACYGAGNGTGGRGGKIGSNCVGGLEYVINAENGNGTTGGGSAGRCVTPGNSAVSGMWTCVAAPGQGSLEGGGGGGGAWHGGGTGGGGGATFFGKYGSSADSAFFSVAAGGGGGGSGVYYAANAYGSVGGGGGGGKGGGAGGGDIATANKLYGQGGAGGNNGTTSISNASTPGGASPLGNAYCAGGNANANGQNGYMKISWSNSNKQLLKCNYIAHTNAGGGGGAGQIWVGEINVKPGETISVTPGKGGNGGTSRGANGSNGANTIISGSQSGNIITLFGGAGGNYSDTTPAGGAGAGYSTQKPWKNWTGLSVFDSSNLSQLTALGHGANGGKMADNAYVGGVGGQTYNIENTVLEGGAGGSANSNGSAPNALSYGTGGGGGGGNATYTNNTAGLGGAGQNGYVYFEWGEKSGGGGQSGQVVIKDNIWVTAGVSKVQINIGKGGISTQETSTNWSGLIGKKGGQGEDTVILVDDKEVLRAKGGFGGNPGILVNGTGGGKGDNETETLAGTVSGDDGADEQGGAGASLTKTVFPLLEAIEKVTSTGGLGGSISTSGEGKAGSGYGAGGGGGIYLNNRAYLGGKGSNGMVYIEWKN